MIMTLEQIVRRKREAEEGDQHCYDQRNDTAFVARHFEECH